MRLDTKTRTKLYDDVTLDYDPTGSTVEVIIDGTAYPATWQGSPVNTSGKWTQTAITTGYFAGPSVTASGATVLAAGRHPTETRVTLGGQIIVANSSPIDVIA